VTGVSADASVIILLVEDNADHAELVLRTFEEHRIPSRLLHVTDGEAALDYLLRRGRYSDPESSPRPHLILLDLRLPRIDGLEVLEEIKESAELRDIPTVVLTTSESESDVVRAYERHANSYLVKPVDFAKFIKLMDDLGLYWLGWNRPAQH
jgi:CheY-like chemotaxis protein